MNTKEYVRDQIPVGESTPDDEEQGRTEGDRGITESKSKPSPLSICIPWMIMRTEDVGREQIT